MSIKVEGALKVSSWFDSCQIVISGLRLLSTSICDHTRVTDENDFAIYIILLRNLGLILNTSERADVNIASRLPTFQFPNAFHQEIWEIPV